MRPHLFRRSDKWYVLWTGPITPEIRRCCEWANWMTAEIIVARMTGITSYLR